MVDSVFNSPLSQAKDFCRGHRIKEGCKPDEKYLKINKSHARAGMMELADTPDAKAIWNISPSALRLHCSAISLNDYCFHPLLSSLWFRCARILSSNFAEPPIPIEFFSLRSIRRMNEQPNPPHRIGMIHFEARSLQRRFDSPQPDVINSALSNFGV